jgi:hypothetical protein
LDKETALEKKMESKKLKMQIDPHLEGGSYSNMATVLHSEIEFLLDFGMFLPGRDTIRISNRVVMTPRTAKQLMLALTQNVQNYESKFGEIALPRTPPQFPSSSSELAQ